MLKPPSLKKRSQEWTYRYQLRRNTELLLRVVYTAAHASNMPVINKVTKIREINNRTPMCEETNWR